MSDLSQTLRLARPAGQRVHGVDVNQLLQDIGEASVNESNTELFRLCLDAQRVLVELFSSEVPA